MADDCLGVRYPNQIVFIFSTKFSYETYTKSKSFLNENSGELEQSRLMKDLTEKSHFSSFELDEIS